MYLLKIKNGKTGQYDRKDALYYYIFLYDDLDFYQFYDSLSLMTLSLLMYDFGIHQTLHWNGLNIVVC